MKISSPGRAVGRTLGDDEYVIAKLASAFVTPGRDWNLFPCQSDFYPIALAVPHSLTERGREGRSE